jgi:hypothetical protein
MAVVTRTAADQATREMKLLVALSSRLSRELSRLPLGEMRAFPRGSGQEPIRAIAGIIYRAQQERR